ncbi:hypothetical protein [Arenibacterium halophilum]|nr:hypothetical protein [Arenibacterium halophilum]
MHHLMAPGDLPGPAVEIYLAWWRVVELPVSFKVLELALPNLEPNQIAT